MPQKSDIRFVNRTGGIVRLPTPRGNRIALVPGEWVSEPYYERFARRGNERPNDRKMLTQEYQDGTPVGMDTLPPDTGDSIQAPEQIRPNPVVPSVSPPPPGGCATSCEGGCEFPAETSPATSDRINAEMNEPPQTPAETMQAVQHELEPGIAPPMPAAPVATPAVPSVVSPGNSPVSPVVSPPPADGPPPLVNDEVRELHNVADVMEKYALTDSDVLEVTDGYVKVTMGGEDTFVSRYDLDWTTTHLSQMRRHITGKTGPPSTSENP